MTQGIYEIVGMHYGSKTWCASWIIAFEAISVELYRRNIDRFVDSLWPFFKQHTYPGYTI